jgi:predicted DNA binding CopG/RHH family protein
MQRERIQRLGRPPLGRTRRVSVGMRFDPDLLARLRQLAARRKMGYQSLIHELLAAAVDKIAKRLRR